MTPNGKLRVSFNDVGHGDSIVIHFPDSVTYGIVDCCQRKDAPEKVWDYFDRLLKRGESPIIGFACITHPHIDHYRGFGALLNKLIEHGVEIREFWDFPASAKKARSMHELAVDATLEESANELTDLLKVKARLRRRGAICRTLATSARDIAVLAGVSIDVIAPSEAQVEIYQAYHMLSSTDEKREFLGALECQTSGQSCACPADDNTISSALVLRYGTLVLLLGGDLTNCAWRHILKQHGKASYQCAITKASHHGSREGNFPCGGNSVYEHILVEPMRSAVIVSGGYRKDLPHADTLAAIEKVGGTWYCTGPGVDVFEVGCSFAHINHPIVRRHLEAICKTEVVVPRNRGGQGWNSGDIFLTGLRDGSYKITTTNAQHSGSA